MARLKLCDGRNILYQYDTGVEIEICECQTVTECHFVTPGGLVKGDVGNNLCKVPDSVLTYAGVLTVYAFARDGVYGTTRHEFRISVIARPKPADYIDTADESTTIDAICDRLKTLPECKGEKGDKGEPGADGADAEVTAESITDALGYVPAKPEGEYTLIESITLDEDVSSVVRTQEPDGRAYNLRALYIKLTSPACMETRRLYFNVGNTDATDIWTDDKLAYINSVNAINTYGHAAEMFVERMNGVFRSQFLYPDYGSTMLSVYSNHASVRTGAVKAVRIFAYSNTTNLIPAGTKIDIYGVRDNA